MSCADVRQLLLKHEHPDHPGPDESRHLANCPACHAWLRRLVRLERQLPNLPVPAVPPPVALMERLQARPPLVRLPAPPYAERERVREFGRQKLALACSLAATLALFAFAWWAWPPGPNQPQRGADGRDPFVARREARLSPLRTPAERVVALNELAQEYFTEARTKAGDARQLKELARQFERLVQEDLLEHARALPVAERGQILTEVARSLRLTESGASGLVAEWKHRHAEAAEAMQRIAVSAGEADRRLRELARG